MQKAIFFEEAYEKGLLPTLSEGFIFSLNSPDIDNISTKNNPFLIQMILFSGLKSVEDLGNGIKFQAQGKNMFCMLEPANYPQKHVEPTARPQGGTAYMPYRFSECETFSTKDRRYKIMLAKEPHIFFDSFFVDFPAKGDICIIYYIFDKPNYETAVVPFMQDNIALVIKKQIGIIDTDAKNIAKKFMAVAKTLYGSV